MSTALVPIQASDADYFKWRSTLILTSAATPLQASDAPAPEDRIPLLTNIITSFKKNYSQARGQLASAASPGGPRPFSRRELWDDGTSTNAHATDAEDTNRRDTKGQPQQDKANEEELLFANMAGEAVPGANYRWQPGRQQELERQKDEQERQTKRALDEKMKARLLADLDRNIAAEIKHFEVALERARAEVAEQESRARDTERDAQGRAAFSSAWGRR